MRNYRKKDGYLIVPHAARMANTLFSDHGIEPKNAYKLIHQAINTGELEGEKLGTMLKQVKASSVELKTKREGLFLSQKLTFECQGKTQLRF